MFWIAVHLYDILRSLKKFKILNNSFDIKHLAGFGLINTHLCFFQPYQDFCHDFSSSVTSDLTN